MVRGVRHHFLVLLLFVLIVAFSFKKDPSSATVVSADTTKYLSGYAWSSNIGWISFRGTGPDYGVEYNSSTGYLSGYAWSSNIGWISFGCGQSDGTTGRRLCSRIGAPAYPFGSGTVLDGAKLDLNYNRLVGFIRACSVFVDGCSGQLRSQLELGDWDGWIALSGRALDGNPGSPYGVSFDPVTKKFSGYAWGGGSPGEQFIGWISFGPFNSGSGGSGGGGGSGSGGGGGNKGVVLCDTSLCEVPKPIVSCSRDQNSVTVGVPVNWSVTVTPSGGYNYTWLVNGLPIVGGSPNYDITSGGALNSTSLGITYKKVGSWTTDVSVSDASGNSVGKCSDQSTNVTNFIVSDKTFAITHLPSTIQARFSSDSIGAVTFPNVILSISPIPPNGGYSDPVKLKFVKIEYTGTSGTSIKAFDGDNSKTLIVEPQFWISPLDFSVDPSSTISLTKTGPGYQTATLRLRLIKNLTSNDISLPSGRYRLYVDSDSGGHLHGIDLVIENLSSDVTEK